MKKILLGIALIPIFSFAQNPFDLRTNKSKDGKAPTVEAENVDGRNSTKASFFTANEFVKSVASSSQALNYRLLHEPTLGLPNYLFVYNEKQEGGFGINAEVDGNTLDKVLSDLPALFGWDQTCTLSEISRETDELGITHVRYEQLVSGSRVKGGQWILHIQDGLVQSGSGRIYPPQKVVLEKAISAELAEQKAYEHVVSNLHRYVAPSLDAIDRSSKVDEYLDYETSEVLNARLVYTVVIRPTDMHVYRVWVDAVTGDVIKTVDELCEVDGPRSASATDLRGQSRTVKTYQVGSSYYMIDATKSMWTNSQASGFPDNPSGAIWTINANNTQAQSITQVSSNNNTWSDRSSVSAHANAGLAFDYYKNTHNRNSLNGSGGTIISVVNVEDENGAMDNAYWNGQAMFYGNGDVAFKPLAGALDVAGHELTHGVVSNSANLEYEGQSGAINESMADVFGAMMDREDWKMGEDIVKPGVFAGGALRDLQNPHNGTTSNGRGYQPEKMSEYYTGSQDNYGVHINSGIVNRAYYLAATGSGMTVEKAEKIWYRALTQYLTTRSQFLDLRYAVVDATKDLYGATEIAAVKNAFDVVQIYDPNGNSGGGGSTGGSGNDIPTNAGAENIISVDVDASNSNTFYKSSTTPDDYEALTQNTPKRKCSVRDDGQAMYYVSSSNDLRRILLTSPYTESIISNEDWDNVAVSKDGSKLALISTVVDGLIWIYDFNLESFKSFTLYNPTYTEGVDAGNVNYADALEFDNTGQYVLYDAENEITNSSGQNISWWDVGIIRIWDNETDNWGDGKVEKVFTQLPDNVSIGNASFAKNSPHIIAFDYIDGNSGNYSVRTTNLLNGDVETIITQSRLGFPNYSNKDDILIFDAANSTGDDVIGKVELEANKLAIKSGTIASVLIPDAKWGVWYANGSRNLLSDKKDILSFSFPGLSGSPEGVISGSTITIGVPSGTNLASLTPTFTISADAKAEVGSAKQTSGVTAQNFSNDLVYRISAQDETVKNYTVKVNIVASVDDLQRSIHVYPNPTNGVVTIFADVHIESIRCIAISGNEVLKQANDKTFDISTLASGIYFIEIYTAQGKIVKRIQKL
jgi:Zn-dependent metalloprotease